jgi:hypothetical protein
MPPVVFRCSIAALLLCGCARSPDNKVTRTSPLPAQFSSWIIHELPESRMRVGTSWDLGSVVYENCWAFELDTSDTYEELKHRFIAGSKDTFDLKLAGLLGMDLSASSLDSVIVEMDSAKVVTAKNLRPLRCTSMREDGMPRYPAVIGQLGLTRYKYYAFKNRRRVAGAKLDSLVKLKNLDISVRHVDSLREVNEASFKTFRFIGSRLQGASLGVAESLWTDEASFGRIASLDKNWSLQVTENGGAYSVKLLDKLHGAGRRDVNCGGPCQHGSPFTFGDGVELGDSYTATLFVMPSLKEWKVLAERKKVTLVTFNGTTGRDSLARWLKRGNGAASN